MFKNEIYKYALIYQWRKKTDTSRERVGTINYRKESHIILLVSDIKGIVFFQRCKSEHGGIICGRNVWGRQKKENIHVYIMALKKILSGLYENAYIKKGNDKRLTFFPQRCSYIRYVSAKICNE